MTRGWLYLAGQEVRLAGLDAPEWDQKAKHRDGYWFSRGKRVKSALIQEIRGKHVRVSVETVDKFGRLLGTVTYKGQTSGNGWCGKDMRLPPIVTATYTSSGRRVKPRAACGDTPTTSIPEPTGTAGRGRIEAGYVRPCKLVRGRPW